MIHGAGVRLVIVAIVLFETVMVQEISCRSSGSWSMVRAYGLVMFFMVVRWCGLR